MVVDGTSRVSLSNGKVIHDRLHDEGEKFVGVYDRVGSGKVAVKVHYGSVNISITYQKRKFSY
jgi:hypothetical protein